MQSLSELLEYAIKRRDAELIDGKLTNIIYWNGYIDAINTIKRAIEVRENDV